MLIKKERWFNMYFEKVLPEDEGISTLAIKNFLTNAAKEGIELHSYIIIRRSKIVDEGYFYPYAKDNEHMMYSVSKTFVALAIGYLIAEDKISLEDKITEFFGDYNLRDDPNLNELKIKDLLSMTAGIKEEPNFYFNDNWIEAYLETDFIHPPGTVFKYVNLNYYMLSVIACKVSGMSLVDYLYQKLFSKLDIEKPDWDCSIDGYEAGGWGLFLRSEDLAKVADVMMHDGYQDGNEIIPAFWLEKMFQVYADTKNHSNQNKDYLCGYGYGVWLCHDLENYRLDGVYGQFAFLFKQLDVVIITTASTYNSQKIMDLIYQDLIPYFIDETLSFHSAYYRQLMNLNKELSLITTNSVLRSSYEAKIRNATFQFKTRTIGFVPFIIQALNGSLSTGPSGFSMDFNNKGVTLLWNEYDTVIELSASYHKAIYHMVTIDERVYKIACHCYFEKRNRFVLMVYFLSYPHARKIVFDFMTRNRCIVQFIECPNIKDPIDSLASLLPVANKKINKVVFETLYTLIDRSGMAVRKKKK